MTSRSNGRGRSITAVALMGGAIIAAAFVFLTTKPHALGKGIDMKDSPDPDDEGHDSTVNDADDAMGTFPPFDDPASSSRPAEPPVTDRASEIVNPPKDTQYAGHPDFSQDAAGNKRFKDSRGRNPADKGNI